MHSRPQHTALPGDGTATVDLTDMLRAALQRSEHARVWLVVGTLLISAASVITRHLEGGTLMQGMTFEATLAILAGALAAGAGFVVYVGRANRAGRLLPDWVWAVSVVVESALPTAVIAILLKNSPLDPMRSVTAPAMLMYAVFAVASVLRLRPWLCVLGGVVCAAGHVALVRWALLHEPAEAGGPRLGPMYYTYPLAIGICWGVAAVVSAILRGHVVSSLREARTRVELESVRGKLNLAREVQAGLLPKEPLTLPGLEVVGFNRPADETGGDYFDWIPLADGRVAAMIADVTGHGIGPAILMAVCRAYARATVPGITPLSGALTRLNALIAEDFTSGRFVTLAIALVDPRSGEVELLSAGHGPTLLYRNSDGAVETFGGDGLPLGVVPDIEFDTSAKFTLAPGDALLLTTDGFFETARADGRLYGAERLTESFRRHADKPCQELLGSLDADRTAFAAGEAQHDDVTAVLVRRLQTR